MCLWLRVIVYVCVCERVRASLRVRAFVCVCARVRAFVCVCVRGRVCLGACVYSVCSAYRLLLLVIVSA